MVYCSCFETGTLNEPPPYPDLISVGPDGSLEFKSQDLDVLLELDQWLLNRACAHKNGTLLHHRIGNMAQVGLLRGELYSFAQIRGITNTLNGSGSKCESWSRQLCALANLSRSETGAPKQIAGPEQRSGVL